MRRSQPTFAPLLAAFIPLLCVWEVVGQTIPTTIRYPETEARSIPIDDDVATIRLNPVAPDRNVSQLPFQPDHAASVPQQSEHIEAVPAATGDEFFAFQSDSLAGNRLLAKAVTNIATHRSISANIRHRISLFGHELVGSGTYQQMDIGEDRLLRLELKIPLDDQITSLTQICDARFLWTQRTMPGDDQLQETEVSRVDLSRIRRAVRLNGGEQSAGAFVSPSLNGLLIGQGGLPQLLIELERHFDFYEVQPGVLQDVPIWMASGRWKPAAREQLFPVTQESDPQTKRLPPQVPEFVRVVLGREDLLPYQIDYRRKTVGDAELESRLDDTNSVAILTMELFRVEVGGAIDPNQFTFNTANQRIIDRTNEYLSQFRSTKK